MYAFCPTTKQVLAKENILGSGPLDRNLNGHSNKSQDHHKAEEGNLASQQTDKQTSQRIRVLRELDGKSVRVSELVLVCCRLQPLTKLTWLDAAYNYLLLMM